MFVNSTLKAIYIISRKHSTGREFDGLAVRGKKLFLKKLFSVN